MTEPRGTTAAAPATTRARQATTDLTLEFVTESTVRQIATLGQEPDWLVDERMAALRSFAELPIEKNQLYTPYVDLRNAQLGAVAPYLEPQTAARAEGTVTELLPEGAAALVELREDRVPALVLSPAARDAGVVLDTLSGLRARDPQLLRRLLEASPLPEDDKLAQLSRAVWTQGVVLHVPSGVRLTEPIVLRWAMGAASSGLVTRTLLSIGEDAEVSIVEEQIGSLDTLADAHAVPEPRTGQAFFSGTTELHVGPNSNVAFAGLQDFSLDEIAFQQRAAVVGQGASLRWAMAHLGSRVIRSRIDNRLQGDGATVEQAEIVFGSSDQLFDLTSYTRHVGRDTTGNLLSKAALVDRSRTYLKGMISIEKSAHGTDSFLGEFGMLLSRQARSVAIPSLEIDQPDCRRAAHSSSVGPMDESQLFYLESRGIPPDEARKFIILGFLEPVVARVPLASAQDRLRALLEAKWTARTVGARPGRPDRPASAA